MAQLTVARSTGKVWVILSAVADILAVPIGLMGLPVVVVGRTVEELQSQNRLRDLARTESETRKALRLHARRQRRLFEQYLRESREIERTFLLGVYDTSEQAEKAWMLAKAAQQRLLEHAHELISDEQDGSRARP